MSDPFISSNPTLADPADNATPVTKSDTAVISSRFLYIGGAGDLTVDLYGAAGSADPILFKNVPVGIFPFRVKRVRTASTATDIVACW